MGANNNVYNYKKSSFVIIGDRISVKLRAYNESVEKTIEFLTVFLYLQKCENF